MSEPSRVRGALNRIIQQRGAFDNQLSYTACLSAEEGNASYHCTYRQYANVNPLWKILDLNGRYVHRHSA